MKKVYEEPSVKKVEFEFNERIAASSCGSLAIGDDPLTGCSLGI